MFLQAESELAAIYMVYGAAATGTRVMTSSSSLGISLKQEGISYLAAGELPSVIINISRAGIGLGGLGPAQGDYFQATRGGGHGDYRTIVLAPENVQEAVDFVMKAFDLADQYRTPVMVYADGAIGQMMEPVEFKDYVLPELPVKDWNVEGTGGNREKRRVSTYDLGNENCQKRIMKLDKKYTNITENETKAEVYNIDDAEIVCVAYGTPARVVRNAIEECKNEGIKVGLIRPITLWPYPYDVFNNIPNSTKAVLTVELNTGQMIDDVKIALKGRALPVYLNQSVGGIVHECEDIVEDIKKIIRGEK